LLETKYGPDAAPLVDRLEKVSAGRNSRLALQATLALLAYTAGKPEQALAVAGQLEIAGYRQIPPDRLSRLSEAQLALLTEINDVFDADEP
jgi:hypothetical protein